MLESGLRSQSSEAHSLLSEATGLLLNSNRGEAIRQEQGMQMVQGTRWSSRYRLRQGPGRIIVSDAIFWGMC